VYAATALHTQGKASPAIEELLTYRFTGIGVVHVPKIDSFGYLVRYKKVASHNTSSSFLSVVVSFSET
jgi:hypothetical protein